MLADCPPEILHKIFSLACVDDGSTACALSITSRYLSAISAPFLFRTVAITGFLQIQCAIERLSSLPMQHRRVEHLMLSDQHPGRETVLSEVAQPVRLRGSFRQTILLRDLVRLVAPTLRTFTCLIYNMILGTLVEHIITVPLPLLTDLTLCLSDERLFIPSIHFNAVHTPLLERFHFASSRYLSSSGASVAAIFAAHSPHLSHIVLSEVRLMPGCTAVLNCMLGRLPILDQFGWMPSDEQLREVRKLPCHVKRVFVQLDAAVTGAASCFESDLLFKMEEMNYKDALVLLPSAPKRTHRQWKDEWRRVALSQMGT